MFATTDRPIVEVLRTAFVLGVALVALVPSVREAQTAFGWLPLWLVGMPAVVLLLMHTVQARAVDAVQSRLVRTAAMRRPATGVPARRRIRRTQPDRAQRSA